MAIGILGDSRGDLQAFDAAFELLREKGAKRFWFLGGRYSDLDEWSLKKRAQERGGSEYGATDFVADVAQFLAQQGPARAAVDPDGVPLKDRFLRVPEKECLQYRDGSCPKVAVDMVGDLLCCVVHDKNDLTRDDMMNATLLVHGRSREPKVVQIGPRSFVTPGPLAGAAEQTCGLLEQEGKQVYFSAFRLDGRTLVDRQPIETGGRTKLTVK